MDESRWREPSVALTASDGGSPWSSNHLPPRPPEQEPPHPRRVRQDTHGSAGGSRAREHRLQPGPPAAPRRELAVPGASPFLRVTLRRQLAAQAGFDNRNRDLGGA